MGVYSLSEAERQRRSERAKRLHAEGKLGTQAIVRKASARGVEVRTQMAEQRASRRAQRFFDEHYELWEKAMLDGLRKGSTSTRVRAAETIAKLALAGERVDTTAVKVQHEHADREELLTLLASKLTQGPAGALLARRLSETHPPQALDVVDGEATELS